MSHILIFEEYNDGKLFHLLRRSFGEIKHEVIGLNEYQKLIKAINTLGSKYIKYRSISLDHRNSVGIKVILRFIVPKKDIEFGEDDYIISADIEKSEDEYYYVRFNTNNSTYYRYKCDGIEGVKELLDCFN